jgi:uracil-DNA glycosylase
MFTGDRSGEWLYAALRRAGFANQATSVSRDDGLELRSAFVSAAVRCAPPANRPTTDERSRCLPFLERELAVLTELKVVLALGKFAYDALAAPLGLRRRPPFGHGVEVQTADGRLLVCSYHPSQQNTFTGRLTTEMLDSVLHRCHQVADGQVS